MTTDCINEKLIKKPSSNKKSAEQFIFDKKRMQGIYKYLKILYCIMVNLFIALLEM